MSQQIAQTIRTQIGTDALLAISARDFRWITKGLAFRFGSRYGNSTLASITLDPSDTYSVTVTKTPTRGRNAYIPQVVYQVEGIYFDQLPELMRTVNQEVS
jgi:hypothetical protein